MGEPGERDIKIEKLSIPLGSFLKWSQAVESGGAAKLLIQSGHVRVNGRIEIRRHRPLGLGDVVELSDGRVYRVVGGGSPN